jgi:hypothetical protein
MSQKWNLQDIRPAEPRKRRPVPRPESTRPQNTTHTTEQTSPIREREDIPNVVIEDGRKKGKSRLLLSVIIFVVIVGGATALSALLGKTELTKHKC